MPSCSSLSPNSRSEQTMPDDSTPRIFDGLSFFLGRGSWSL